jgi:alkanesulfonate monooxygenase SsuD/methylene tetrahydromethanopterin reductase-like flavin-dependent oxidoreductase (luciferase family)
MSDLKIGLSLGSVGGSFRTMIDLAVEAERTGFDMVTAGDSGSETFALMGAIAVQTERVQLISSIAGWTRTPATMAHAAATVANLSNGRFSLGIGPTPKAWVTGWHGLEFDPVIPRMREYLRAVRACLTATADSPTDVDGEYFPSHGYTNWDIELADPVPLVLGVSQRHMTELSGELCDGVMLNSIHPIEWIEKNATAYLATGRARGPLAGQPVERGIGRFVGIHDDRATAYDLCRAQLSFYFAIPYFRTLLEPFGFDAELAAGEKALRDGDKAAQIAAVSDRMVDEIALAGSPAEVLEKLGRYDGLVDWVSFGGGFNLDTESANANYRRLIEVFGRR